VAKTFW